MGYVLKGAASAWLLSACALTALTALASCTAGSGDPPNASGNPTTHWAEEPEAVLGIKLGRPLLESGLPKCPELGDKGQLCTAGHMVDSVELRGIPLANAREGTIMMHNGAVQGVELRFKSFSYSRMETVLTERYGKPQLSQGDVHLWVGRQVRLALVRTGYRPDEGYALFTHMPTWDARKATENAADKQSAKKL